MPVAPKCQQKSGLQKLFGLISGKGVQDHGYLAKVTKAQGNKVTVIFMLQCHWLSTLHYGLKHIKVLQITLRISVAEACIPTTHLLLLSMVARLQLKHGCLTHVRIMLSFFFTHIPQKYDFCVIKLHLKFSLILRDFTVFANFPQISK